MAATMPTSRSWSRLLPLGLLGAVVVFGLLQLVPGHISHPPVKAEQSCTVKATGLWRETRTNVSSEIAEERS